MNDSPMLQALSAIQATVQHHLVSNQGIPTTQHPPSFDPRTVYSAFTTSLPDVSNQVASLGLPAQVAAEITSLLSVEGTNYQNSVAYKKQQLLDELSTSTVSPNPSALPSLVEAACQAFYNSTIHSCFDTVQRHLGELTLDDEALSDNEAMSGSDASSSYESDDDPIDEEVEDADEDDNTPIKAGEEVPPLETKYLPIFEALHERGKVLTKPEKTYLVNMTGMTYRQITIWFQNRRRGELKEDLNRAASSRADSVHSATSSDVSGDELDLEQRLLNTQSDTSFDIRSWRLTSAFPTKDGHGASLPPSPTKLYFGTSIIASHSDTEDTDLSGDSDDDAATPPGLRVPSLTMSATTINSTTVSAASSQMMSNGVSERAIIASNASNGNQFTSSRPIKPLPQTRLGSPPSTFAPTAKQAPAFTFNFANTRSTERRSPTTALPPSSITSNERGLTVHMDITPPASTLTLQGPSTHTSIAPPNQVTSTPPGTSPCSPPASNNSPRSISPTPSRHSASSPRPIARPLPRRTGCAPRPRPPPRAGSASAPVPGPPNALGSSRASIVLPPASNPSLGNTTLGTLLRPNQPTPKVPPEMEERLAAMAGRMGVGANASFNPAVNPGNSVHTSTVPRSLSLASFPRSSTSTVSMLSPTSRQTPQRPSGS